MFFSQTPSFLAYQREMQVRQWRDNAQSLFGVTAIPSDNEIRNLLDPVAPSYVGGLYWETFAELEAQGLLADHRGLAGQWLCALDGVQFYSSNAIHCDRCTHHTKGDKTLYTHSVIAPVLVAPVHDYVISLEPEFITPQDGAAKQDCEQAAMRRWLERQVHHFAPGSLTVLTDDLHSHQPTCLWLREHHCHFIMVCLPDSHPFLHEQVAELTKLNLVSEVVARHWNGRYWERRTYHFVNDLFLRNSADAILVNWCEIVITREDTQATLYHNAFITDHRITAVTHYMYFESWAALLAFMFHGLELDCSP